MIIRAFEKIKINGLSGGDIFDCSPEILAKIDTGAFSGVIHAENIQEENGILSFDLMGKEKFRLETKDFTVRRVRNTHGGAKRRYLVGLEIQIGDEKFDTLLGLDDRSRMRFDMLLGRAFLNKYEILIDTHKNIEFDKEWKKMGGEQ
jgi:hypothetical protein